MTLLGMGAIAVAAVVLGLVALPVVADQWSDNRDEGKHLAAATGATMRKADDLGTSFGSLIPARAEAAAEEDGDGFTQTAPESPAVSNDPVGSGHDVQHEVAAALEALASVDTGKNDVSAAERIVAIENLRDIWSPRYRQAEEEHRRNCSDLRGSNGYPASCGGAAKHGWSSANQIRPLKREHLRIAALSTA